MRLPERVSGNIYLRPITLDAVGDRVVGHTHNFDHTTFVWSGAVRVLAHKNGERIADQEFVAPAHFLVKADVEHEITATQPNTLFYCVYAHRDPQGRVTQVYNGWTGAYQ